MFLLPSCPLISNFKFFFFKQKTAYELRISDWEFRRVLFRSHARVVEIMASIDHRRFRPAVEGVDAQHGIPLPCQPVGHLAEGGAQTANVGRSEEHTSELQSLMRISYAVFCLKKKTKKRSKTTSKP